MCSVSPYKINDLLHARTAKWVKHTSSNSFSRESEKNKIYRVLKFMCGYAEFFRKNAMDEMINGITYLRNNMTIKVLFEF